MSASDVIKVPMYRSRITYSLFDSIKCLQESRRVSQSVLSNINHSR